MVEANSKWRVSSFWFCREVAILVVTAVFVINPNDRLHGVAAASNGEFGENQNTNLERNHNRRYNYRTEGEDFYSPYNPLWREEQIYTGERRGPVSDPSSLRRPRRVEGTTPPSYSPLALRIQDIDDVSSTSSYSEFPLQSADIGSTGSRSNDIHPEYDEKPRSRRKLSFPIDFRRQRCRLNIGHPADNDLQIQGQNKPESRKAKMRKNFFSSGNNGGEGSSIKKLSNRNPVSRDGQVSVSLDPFSLATLLQNGASGLVGITSVYVGTLKLLGPMILAKHCLATVGYFINNRYHGMLARKAVTQRLSYSEPDLVDQQDRSGAVRACTRTLFQILCMSCTGRFVGFVLNHTSCLLRPVWICQWWYGVVWLASVYTIGFLCQEWVFGNIGQNGNTIQSWLSIKPTSGPINFKNRDVSSVNSQYRRRNMTRPLFRFIQKMSQNPEEWANNLFRSFPRWQSRKNSHWGRKTMAEGEVVDDISLDPLLFPSTWKPLAVVTFLALSRAICQSFCLKVSPSGTLGDAACRENKQYLIMRSFIIQKTLHSEWHRVFAQERRVALGAWISAIGLLALLWSMYSVSRVDSIAAIAMFPILMAQIVGSWINVLLIYNQIDVPPETISWRDLASRLDPAHD